MFFFVFVSILKKHNLDYVPPLNTLKRIYVNDNTKNRATTKSLILIWFHLFTYLIQLKPLSVKYILNESNADKNRKNLETKIEIIDKRKNCIKFNFPQLKFKIND